MTRIICKSGMGKSEKGWLHSIFHFSFAAYYNPKNMNFGTLRVVNDDVFDPGSGFDTHPHKDMEIISYVVGGTLTHQDSLGNRRELTRGQVQYMSAGTGVQHSEHNLGAEPLRFLQIWILPDQLSYAPQYGDHHYRWEDRENQWLRIASGAAGSAPVVIHQSVEVSVLWLDAGQEESYILPAGRMGYLIQIEGDGMVNSQALYERDAAEIAGENIVLSARSDSHYILFDLPEQ